MLSNTNKLLMYLSEIYFYFFIFILSLLGYKLVWTVHNLIPHERTFIHDNKVLIKLLSSSSSLVVLNTDTYELLKTQYGVSENKMTKLPIGNYIGIYKSYPEVPGNTITRLLFVGQIRPYKGIEDLINAFTQINPRQNVKLTIIGKCPSIEYWDKLKTMTDSIKDIFMANRYVSDDDLGKLLANSDIVALPFKKVTNTSTAILAFSMHKPVIAPLLGSIKDYPSNTGFYYNADNKDGLRKAILFAMTHKRLIKKYSDKALEYAKTLDWNLISLKTASIYKSLLIKS
jgi:glycosyltransferase involved in cell wall biosynthesis